MPTSTVIASTGALYSVAPHIPTRADWASVRAWLLRFEEGVADLVAGFEPELGRDPRSQFENG